MNGNNELYLTQIKLNGLTSQTAISSITTSDNIIYGTKDMYTTEDGQLYMYLPVGSRTITVTANGKTYSGTVNTTETSSEVIILN